MYGILIDGQPVQAPNPVHINGRAIYNPSGSTYAAMGYLPIVETPYPDASDPDTAPHYAAAWTERDGQIVRVWVETDLPVPEPTPPTTEERLAALEGAMLAMMGGAENV